MTHKLLSTCCKAPAKPDISGDGTGMYFCTSCVKPCDVKSERSGFGSRLSTLSKVRKPTGERALFVELWAKAGGKSEVSGAKLYPPEHALFVHQGSHLLPKGTYPDYRLDPRNVVMITPEEHETWHREPKGVLLADPRWAPIVARYKALQREAETKRERA